MADDRDTALREMAAHRGLRLVKSRRRTPGVGDYGRYGLVAANGGEKCFGFGADGLTATPEEIAGHLRGHAVSTWQQSAEMTPDRPEPEPEPVPAVERPGRQARTERSPSPSRAPARDEPAPKAKAAPKPEAAPAPPPRLTTRPATKGDAAAIVALLRALAPDPDPAMVEKHIAAQARAGTPLLVAERGTIVGCLDWAVLPTLHLGRVGRVTLLLVAERVRRQGTGRALIDGVAPLMHGQGCAAMEVIADIEIRNANGFFRRTGFTQTSYRLSRTIASPPV